MKMGYVAGAAGAFEIYPFAVPADEHAPAKDSRTLLSRLSGFGSRLGFLADGPATGWIGLDEDAAWERPACCE